MATRWPNSVGSGGRALMMIILTDGDNSSALAASSCWCGSNLNWRPIRILRCIAAFFCCSHLQTRNSCSAATTNKNYWHNNSHHHLHRQHQVFQHLSAEPQQNWADIMSVVVFLSFSPVMMSNHPFFIVRNIKNRNDFPASSSLFKILFWIQFHHPA